MERVVVDIPCDPTQIDHTGRPWAFRDEAAAPDRIVEGAIVVTGDADVPTKVHFGIPPAIRSTTSPQCAALI